MTPSVRADATFTAFMCCYGLILLGAAAWIAMLIRAGL